MEEKNVKKEEKLKEKNEIVKKGKKEEIKTPKEKFSKVNKNVENKKVENKDNKDNKAQNKKIEKAQVSEKKEKKSKKWLLILILLIVLIILALMVLYTSITPRTSVNDLLTNLKNGNKFMANININYDELIATLDSTIALNGGNSMTNLEKECFNDLSWEITGESVENGTGTVTATITTKNFRQVLLNWIEKISEVLENQEDIETEQNLQLLEESLMQDNVDTKTNEVTINLERKGLTWKVIIDDNFIEAMYPGLNQVLDVMKQLSNELQEETAQQQ